MRVTDTHIYFWKSYLSNFNRSIVTLSFEDNTKHTFPTSEHAYMWLKAHHFGDTESMRALEEARTPAEAKSIGRAVNPFDQDEWNQVSYDAMFRACWSKFKDNQEVGQKLVDT